MKNRDKETREQRRRDRLGSEDPRCGGCGETDTRCLELHHIAGQHFGDDLIVLCRNCHRKRSDDQEDHPLPSQPDPPWWERLAHWLLGLADLFRALADQATTWAQFLLELTGDLPPIPGGDPA